MTANAPSGPATRLPEAGGAAAGSATFDVVSEAAIAAVLDAFYARVRLDPELGPVFARAVTDEAWPAHMAVIADFWSSVMLKTGRYKGNPFAVHAKVEGISPALFARWLSLFGESCRSLLAPDLAAAMEARAGLIAASLQAGLFFRPGVSGPSPIAATAPLP
ncbi:group III truncated hemoglobin [uncultured Enterovirga sp.]|uniref:group III truncated hemoglobin n=1 Tax=uncultured Enterovirga sp. TaxID=2026352 RepID=UPI0035C9F108